MGGVKSKCLLLDKSNKESEFNLGQGYFMKTLKKIGFAVFAICMAFAAVSCKDDDDDSPAVITEWVSEDETITCYDDNTFSVKLDGLVAVTGTYVGDTTKSDVEIKINVTKVAEVIAKEDSESMNLIPYETSGVCKISKDGKSINIEINGVEGFWGTFTKK